MRPGPDNHMEEYNYAAAASTIEIEEIVSCEINQAILIQLNHNDPRFDKLWVTGDDEDLGEDKQHCSYQGEGDHDDLGWLGYFLSKNTHLKGVSFVFKSISGFQH